MSGTPSWAAQTLDDAGAVAEIERDRIRGLCLALGLPPSRVARLEITPARVLATVYVTDEQGRLPIVDGVSGVLLTQRLEFRVIER